MRIGVHFSDFFNVSPEDLDKYGAFNISLISDMPLFIDPFLLFSSNKPEYQALHKQILTYLSFLKEIASVVPLILSGSNNALYNPWKDACILP